MLPPGVDRYANYIDEDWDNLDFQAKTSTPQQVNGYLLQRILYYRSGSYTDSKL
jgi:hypothetical protein